jgi:threonine dehydratase
VTSAELLRLILTSRVYDVARQTPLDPARRLSQRVGHQVFLKREDLQAITRRAWPTRRGISVSTR